MLCVLQFIFLSGSHTPPPHLHFHTARLFVCVRVLHSFLFCSFCCPFTLLLLHKWNLRDDFIGAGVGDVYRSHIICLYINTHHERMISENNCKCAIGNTIAQTRAMNFFIDALFLLLVLFQFHSFCPNLLPALSLSIYHTFCPILFIFIHYTIYYIICVRNAACTCNFSGNR